jgi:hypothetical protein
MTYYEIGTCVVGAAGFLGFLIFLALDDKELSTPDIYDPGSADDVEVHHHD